jgi:hypothetical protein
VDRVPGRVRLGWCHRFLGATGCERRDGHRYDKGCVKFHRCLDANALAPSAAPLGRAIVPPPPRPA